MTHFIIIKRHCHYKLIDGIHDMEYEIISSNIYINLVWYYKNKIKITYRRTGLTFMNKPFVIESLTIAIKNVQGLLQQLVLQQILLQT